MDRDFLQHFEVGSTCAGRNAAPSQRACLGEGRVSTVFALGEGSQTLAFKRLAVFRSDDDAVRYEALHRKYVRWLGERTGVRVLPSATLRVHDAQQAVGSSSTSSRSRCMRIVSDIRPSTGCAHPNRPPSDSDLQETAKVFDLNVAHQGGQEIGFDAYFSNWALLGFDPARPCMTERMRLAYLDTSTPLMRSRGTGAVRHGAVHPRDAPCRCRRCFSGAQL